MVLFLLSVLDCFETTYYSCVSSVNLVIPLYTSHPIPEQPASWTPVLVYFSSFPLHHWSPFSLHHCINWFSILKCVPQVGLFLQIIHLHKFGFSFSLSRTSSFLYLTLSTSLSVYWTRQFLITPYFKCFQSLKFPYCPAVTSVKCYIIQIYF